MRAKPFIALTLLLAACGGDKPDARATPGESKLAAKAVADVDAAMAEAQVQRALPRAAPPLPHRQQ